jgi:hypothetical protein
MKTNPNTAPALAAGMTRVKRDAISATYGMQFPEG